DFFLAGQSAGTDCTGIVQRSAGYPGNPYLLPEIGALYGTNGEHLWTWNDGWDMAAGGARKYVDGRQIFFYDGDNILDPPKPYDGALKKVTNWSDRELDNSVIRKVIPGDIFYYYRQHSITLVWSYHAAIVDRVEYKSTYSTRSDINLEDIKLIEATHATGPPLVGSVINHRNLQFYVNRDDSWRIGRLKQ
ncbi:MAG: hypothetical protein KAR21_01760, partial [Spirochaetales bacterium]|nr:hypothetical protein [Spirochaetales bacterium]